MTEFEWDETKRRANLAKHGADFADAEEFDWAKAVIRIDDRHDYGELRYRAWAPIRGRVYSLAFVRRGRTIRVLSFRKANRTEERRYEKEKS